MRANRIEEADLATLMRRALDGEPQRITGPHQESVVLVSEADWVRQGEAPRRPLADILLSHAGEDFAEIAQEQRWAGLTADEESASSD